MSSLEDIKSDLIRKLHKALLHLEYSYLKVTNLSTDVEKLNDEDLETWEGLSSRFARASNLFLTKYLKTCVLHHDPAFRGSLRDFLHAAEKLNLIDDVEKWMKIRELQNMEAHEYNEESLGKFFNRIRLETPLLLSLTKKIPLSP